MHHKVTSQSTQAVFMSIKPTPHRYIWIVLIAFLAACEKQAVALSTGTTTPMIVSPTSVPTSTLIPVTFTPSPLPTQPIIPVITADPIQVKRWKEYQTAIAIRFLSYLSPEEVICEWDNLGQSDQEVYVWAICTGTNRVGNIEEPAVIHIEMDGSVQSVETPRGGTLYASDIRRMFSPDAQERIFSHSIDYHPLYTHLKWRQEHPEEPPLIVLSATPKP